MPAPNDPGKLLSAGQFYSPIQSSLRTDEVVLSELRQPCSRKVPRHEHELAYVTIVLDGNYEEGDHGRLDQLPPFTAVFNPSGATHSTNVGPAGASFFTIELRNHHLQELGLRLPQQTMFDRCAETILWPGLRLYSAFKAHTAKAQATAAQSADALVTECHVMEMLGAISDLSSPQKVTPEKTDSADSAPKWFRRVKECLHEQFRGSLRLGELANDAGVHPVHLARVFRKIEKQTPGDYVQRLRVQAACHLLREPDYPLAIVAVECGFADQSHFTRVFKKLTRTTPAQFRQAVRS